jgi:enoyl-CoA hydratase
MTAPEQPVLLVEREGGIATLTLNRPRVRNALSSELIVALQAAMREVDQDDEIDVVILTGSDPAFCAGLDLREVGAGGANMSIGNTATDIGVGAPWPAVRKPIIGAVNGVAVTGGLELALHCDILVASQKAVFADTHARVGVMPGWGLSVLLPRAVGTRMARQMSLTGNYLSADDALRTGLVTAVLPHDELLPYVRGLAEAMVGNDRKGVRTLLDSYRRIEAEATGPGLAIEAETSQAWRAGSFDPAEVEKRRAGIMDRGRAQTGETAG